MSALDHAVVRHPHGRKLRITKAARAAYLKRAKEILNRSGVRCTQGDEYIAETIHGELHIHIYEDWLACRFSSVESLPADANKYSGKWNFHGAYLLDSFERQLTEILR